MADELLANNMDYVASFDKCSLPLPRSSTRSQ